jgi:hypothetical protein
MYSPRIDIAYSTRPGEKLCECYVCGAYTDAVLWKQETVFYRNGKTTREPYPTDISVCSNEKMTWHTEIQEKIKLLILSPHPKSYHDELLKEILNLRKENRDKRLDSVAGSFEREIVLIEPHFWEKEINFSSWTRIWKAVAPKLRREKTERRK